MKRFLAMLFALLVPLQSAMGAVVPITVMGSGGCDPSFAPALHHGNTVGSNASASACDCASTAHSGAHGIGDDHACPHLGMAFVAVAPATRQFSPVVLATPKSKHASFASIVLDVPSPPPTRSA